MDSKRKEDEQKRVDAFLGISDRDRRIFDAVHEFACACDVPGAYIGLSQQLTLEQMVRSSVLSIYGSSWVTEDERDVCAKTVTCLLEQFAAQKRRAYHQLQHEDHQKHGVAEDPDCEVCIEIDEATEPRLGDVE